MSNKTNKMILAGYLAGFVVIAAVIALLQPLADTPPLYGNPPDEHARFLIPRYIYEHGRIPTGFEEEVRIPAYGFSYGLYNVFPYIVQGYVMRFAGLFTDSMQTLLYTARFVNVISGCLMAIVVYLLSQKLFENKGFRWVFCFGIMYLPQCLFMHTYVNTDSMCLLSTAMMLYALAGAYQEGFTRKNNLWLCAGIILCALSYYNAYGYILSSILLFLAYFLNKKDGKWNYSWKEMWKKAVFICGIVLLGIGWWFIRSYILFDGDIIGFATREKMAIQYAIPQVNPLTMPTYGNKGYTIWEMMKENYFLEGAFFSFIAAYGSMSIFADVWIYRAYKLFLSIGLLSCVLLPGMKQCKSLCEKLWYRRFFHINMIFCILMPLILLIRYAYTMDYQNQGRYLLPAIIPLMYYVTRGLEKLADLSKVPQKLVYLGIVLSVLLPVLSTVWMTCFAALPVYLETGMVLQ